MIFVKVIDLGDFTSISFWSLSLIPVTSVLRISLTMCCLLGLQTEKKKAQSKS